MWEKLMMVIDMEIDIPLIIVIWSILYHNRESIKTQQNVIIFLSHSWGGSQ